MMQRYLPDNPYAEFQQFIEVVDGNDCTNSKARHSEWFPGSSSN